MELCRSWFNRGSAIELEVLCEIVVRAEHASLRVETRVAVDLAVKGLLVGAVLRVLLEEMLMASQYMLHQAVLVPGPVRAEGALELWIDPALEVVVTLQVVLVLVGFAAGHAGVLERQHVLGV